MSKTIHYQEKKLTDSSTNKINREFKTTMIHTLKALR